MEMVAASKLRRAQDRVRAARPYAAKLTEVISGLFAPELAERYPILRQPEKVQCSALVLITSNRGLAGGFNVNLIRKARGVLGELRDDGVDVEFHVVGRKGINFFQFRREPMASRRQDITDRPSMDDARSIIDPLIPRFESGALDPVSPPDDGRGARAHNYLFEPSAEEILTTVLPLYVRNAVYRALVESAAAEQGARMTAMKNATDNADELIKTLTLQYNKARQAQITQELTEITGGSEALRG